MSFFGEAEPAPAPGPSYRMPEWIGPPENVIPATVALDVILARRPDLAIWVADALVFPSGLSFGINIQRREESDERSLFFGVPDPDGPRFGLRLGDGRKVIVRHLGEMSPGCSSPAIRSCGLGAARAPVASRAPTCGSGLCRRPASSRSYAPGKARASRKRARRSSRGRSSPLRLGRSRCGRTIVRFRRARTTS